jgi:hypothetical protein
MSDTLRVRAYNSGAGDTFLVSLLRNDVEIFNILVDFGFCWRCHGMKKKRGSKSRLREVTGGIYRHKRPDIIVLSHMHWDHISGLCPESAKIGRKRRMLTDEHQEIWIPIQCSSEYGGFVNLKGKKIKKYSEIINSIRTALKRNQIIEPGILQGIKDLLREIGNPKAKRYEEEKDCSKEIRAHHKGKLFGVFSLSADTPMKKYLKAQYGLEITVLSPLPTERYVIDSLVAFTSRSILSIASIPQSSISAVAGWAQALGLSWWDDDLDYGEEYHRGIERYSEVLGDIVSIINEYNFLEHIDELKRLEIEDYSYLEPSADRLWSRLERIMIPFHKYIAFGVEVGAISHKMLSTGLAFMKAASFTVRNPLIHAENGASIVISIKHNDTVLLFTGDARTSEWRAINHLDESRKILEMVDFFKVSHHAAKDGVPPKEIIDKILPKYGTLGRKPQAVVTTCFNPTKQGKPHCRKEKDHYLDHLRGRAAIYWSSEFRYYNDFKF